MAIRFSAATDRLVRTANLPSLPGPWEMHFWISFAVLPAPAEPSMTMVYIGEELTSPYTWVQLVPHIDASQIHLRLEVDGWTAYLLDMGAVIDTWYSVALVRGADADRTVVYWNGSLQPDPAWVQAQTGACVRMEWGAAQGWLNSGPLNGRIAAIKWWDIVLSDAERGIERGCVRASRRPNLQGEYPLVEPVLADNATDLSGNGRDLTIEGTPTVEAGPQIPLECPAPPAPIAVPGPQKSPGRKK